MTNRRFRLIAATQALLPILAGAALMVSSATHDAPMGSWVAYSQAEYDAAREFPPLPTPTMTKADHRAFPQCDSSTDNLRPKLVMNQDREVKVLTFDEALKVSKDGNHWVIGSC